MMSSSEHAPAPSPWALDELDTTLLFAPLYSEMDDGRAGAMNAGVGPVATPAPEPMFDAAAVDGLLEHRLAELRPALEQAAFARGREEGLRLAAEQGREQVGRVVSALTDALASVRAHEQRWLGNIEENLAAVAVTIARHLIHRELTVTPSVVTELVARALHEFPLEKRLVVRLHPDDNALVREALTAGTTTIDPALEILWVADPNVVRGGCLVEGRERVLDGRMDTALERAYRALGQVQA